MKKIEKYNSIRRLKYPKLYQKKMIDGTAHILVNFHIEAYVNGICTMVYWWEPYKMFFIRTRFEKDGYLKCPIKNREMTKRCKEKSIIVAKERSYVFRCPHHGLFEINEEGNLVS